MLEYMVNPRGSSLPHLSMRVPPPPFQECDQGIHSRSLTYTLVMGASNMDEPLGVGAGTRLSQDHDTQLHKMICSSTDFTICTILNWQIIMQLRTQVIENHVTVYPTVQLLIPTFRQGKAIQNDVLTTVYHEVVSDVVTTSYPLLFQWRMHGPRMSTYLGAIQHVWPPDSVQITMDHTQWTIQKTLQERGVCVWVGGLYLWFSLVKYGHSPS